MKKITLEEKALRVIEWLVSGDFGEDIGMKLSFGYRFGEEDTRKMAELLGEIYTITHAVNPHSCYKVHANWRDNLTGKYKKLKRKHLVA